MAAFVVGQTAPDMQLEISTGGQEPTKSGLLALEIYEVSVGIFALLDLAVVPVVLLSCWWRCAW